MSTAQAMQSPAKQSHSGSTSALARAMAPEYTETSPSIPQGSTSLAEAMKNINSGKQFAMPQDGTGHEYSENYIAQQQEELKQQQERARLHEEVNPTRMEHVFDARRKNEKARIDKLQAHFIQASKPIKEAHPEVANELFKEATADQGLTGTGMINYLEKVGQTIAKYTVDVKSSGAWLNVGKGIGKRKQGLGAGDTTAKVQKTMYHENANGSSGAG